MRVIVIENDHMIWQDRQDGGTWLWYLVPIDDTHTRLITRRRIRYECFKPWIIYLLMQDVADIIMMRKCMLGVKKRVEGLIST